MMTLSIKTKRLHITEFDESMAESVPINSLDADNRRFIPDEAFETVEEARETITTLMSFYTQKDKPLVYPVILHDGRQIGHVQAMPVEDGWEVGYHITKPYAGNGYATEAVSAFLPQIMEWLGITHICGICNATNIASRKVLEKCGFLLKYEGAGILHEKEQSVCRYEKAHLTIRLITENKKDFLPLLLLGDEQESHIGKYLDRGDMFALYDADLKSVCVVTDEGDEILEIQNLATDKRHQRQGYASQLIDYVAGYYARRYDKIILGTGDVPGTLAFYEHCGFAVTHRVPDYFTINYDRPIIEDGVLLKDQVYLERKLRQKETKNIILETNRLILREMTQSDFPLLCKHLQDAEVMYAYEHAFSDVEVQEGIDKQLQSYEQCGFGVWAVILKENGELIGHCGLSMQPCEDRKVLEIGYVFQKKYWHKGYATEAAIACREYAFNALDADEVFSLIRDTNIASQNVAKRNGMGVRGTFTKHYYGIDMPHYIFSAKRQRKDGEHG